MPESHYAAKPTLSFAKLVANPTDLAWSQAYNAGNLFACLALSLDEPLEEVLLQSVGKDVFNLLQSEFFALEEKTPDTIKEAIKVSTAKVPKGVHVSLTLANFKESALTVFIAGTGKIIMKRGEKIGVLLSKNTLDEEIVYASGFLENADTIILQTGHFAQGIPHQTVEGALDLELPNDVVEAMSPQVLEQDNGAQAAIVIRYSGPTSQQAQKQPEEKEETLASAIHSDEEAKQHIESDNLQEPQKVPDLSETLPDKPADEPVDEPEVIQRDHQSELQLNENQIDEEEHAPKKPLFTMPSLPAFPKPGLELTHRRKLYLSVAVILFILLAASIFFTMSKQAEEERKALFQQIYPAALKEYETAQGIESLNPEGSREAYERAASRLQEGEAKIAKGTEEYKQIEELLAKVRAELSGTPEQEANTLQEAIPDKNTLVALAKANPDVKGLGQNTTTVYMVSSDNISSVTKSNGNKKELVANDKAWTSPQAVVPYQTNFYVLDQKNGVLKYVPSGATYTKSSYFTGSAPNLTQATGMAIDSSVWIVTKDGKILKYTRGSQETFGLSGLRTPLNSPSKIITDNTMDSVYVMDNGNRRIVQFDKKGVFQKEYAAGVIANAKEFELDQKNNRFLILSGDKIWELPL